MVETIIEIPRFGDGEETGPDALVCTKDQYKAALAAGLSKEQALAACGRMTRQTHRLLSSVGRK